jgi:hypothetical protein
MLPCMGCAVAGGEHNARSWQAAPQMRFGGLQAGSQCRHAAASYWHSPAAVTDARESPACAATRLMPS